MDLGGRRGKKDRRKPSDCGDNKRGQSQKLQIGNQRKISATAQEYLLLHKCINWHK